MCKSDKNSICFAAADLKNQWEKRDSTTYECQMWNIENQISQILRSLNAPPVKGWTSRIPHLNRDQSFKMMQGRRLPLAMILGQMVENGANCCCTRLTIPICMKDTRKRSWENRWYKLLMTIYWQIEIGAWHRWNLETFQFFKLPNVIGFLRAGGDSPNLPYNIP